MGRGKGLRGRNIESTGGYGRVQWARESKMLVERLKKGFGGRSSSRWGE